MTARYSSNILEDWLQLLYLPLKVSFTRLTALIWFLPACLICFAEGYRGLIAPFMWVKGLDSVTAGYFTTRSLSLSLLLVDIISASPLPVSLQFPMLILNLSVPTRQISAMFLHFSCEVHLSATLARLLFGILKT